MAHRWTKRDFADAVQAETDQSLDDLVAEFGSELGDMSILEAGDSLSESAIESYGEMQPPVLPRSRAGWRRWDARMRYPEAYLAAADVEMDRRGLEP